MTNVEDILRVKRDQEQGEPMEKAAKGLRRIGTLVVTAAAMSFLIQSWNEPDSLLRYYSFLGFACVLGCSGVVSGLRLRDSKGARVFLALGVSFLPVIFAQAGAFIYSLVGTAPAYFPAALRYSASPFEVILAIAAAVAVALPIARIGFMALSRENWRRLCALFLFGNGVLILPIRDPFIVSLVAAALGSLLIVEDVRRFARAPLMSHFEAKLGRSMLFLPLVVLLGRTCLYDCTSYIYALISGGIGVACFVYSPFFGANEKSRQIWRSFGALLMFDGWRNYVSGLCVTLSHAGYYELVREMQLPVTYLPFAVLLAALSYEVGEAGRIYRRIAAFFAVTPMIWQMIVIGGLPSAIATVAISTFVSCWALAVEEKGPLYAGAVGLGVGILYHLHYARVLFFVSPWVSLAVLGTLAIFAAAYVERNYNELKVIGGEIGRRWERWK